MKQGGKKKEFIVRHHWKNGRFSAEKFKKALEQIFDHWLLSEEGRDPEPGGLKAGKTDLEKDGGFPADGDKSGIREALPG